MTNAPAWDRGAHGKYLDDDKPMVSRGTDLVLTPHARAIRLSYRRRISKALDALLTSRDPWELSEPICWDDFRMGMDERNRAGEELAAIGWCP